MEKAEKRISRRSLSRVFIVTALIFSLILARPFVIAAADDPSESAGEQESQREKRFEVHGTSTSTFVLRSTRAFGDSVTDSDLFEQIRLNVTVPGDDRYKFHFFGTLKVDLDGNRNKEAFYPFEDLDDTRDSSWVGYVYDAHLDINRINPYLKQVRVGRQASRRDQVVYFDGVAVDLDLPRDVKLSVYGGRSAHFYEENQGPDALIGFGIDYSPLARTRASFDYLYANDDRDATFSDEQNSFVALKVRQRLSSFSKVLIRYRMVNGEGKDIRFRSINSIRKFGIGVNVDYFRQVQDQRELSNELSLFHDVMGVSRPYHNMNVTLRKIWRERHGLHAGFTARRLLEDKDTSSFNREYDRSFVTYEVYDLPYEGITVAITGEHWDSSRDVDSLGLDVGYSSNDWRDGTEVSVGTYYSLYKYDYYFDPGEKMDVRTYYVKGRMRLRDNLTGSLRYEYEDMGENYHTVKMGLKYAF